MTRVNDLDSWNNSVGVKRVGVEKHIAESFPKTHRSVLALCWLSSNRAWKNRPRGGWCHIHCSSCTAPHPNTGLCELYVRPDEFCHGLHQIVKTQAGLQTDEKGRIDQIDHDLSRSSRS